MINYEINPVAVTSPLELLTLTSTTNVQLSSRRGCLSKLSSVESSPFQIQDYYNAAISIKPQPQLHQGIWDIVALHLSAFDSGRRNWVDRILKLQRAAANVAQGRSNRRSPNRASRTNGSVHRPQLTPGPEMIAVVSQVVLTEFWARLSEVASNGTLPNAWLSCVPLNHPFLQPDTTRSRWVVSAADD